MPRAKKGKGEQKGKKVIRRVKVEKKTKKEKVWQLAHTCGKSGHLARDCWRNNIRQVAGDPAHSCSGASVTTHTVNQQHSSAETKPVVRRIENREPIIFDLREGHDEAKDHGIQAIHFYIGDDDYYSDDDDHDEPVFFEDPWLFAHRVGLITHGCAKCTCRLDLT